MITETEIRKSIRDLALAIILVALAVLLGLAGLFVWVWWS